MTEQTKFEKFHYEVFIRENHIDTFGHVNNATYLQLFEEARWEFITQRGYGLDQIRKRKLGPVILECKLKFSREIKLREKVVIESETLSYMRKVGILRQTIKGDDGQVCCDAEMIFGLFDTDQRKLVSPTPEWLNAIGQCKVPMPD
jgi:acyl-CoA thioester hydrolase